MRLNRLYLTAAVLGTSVPRYQSFSSITMSGQIRAVTRSASSSSISFPRTSVSLQLFDFDANLLHEDLYPRVVEVLENAKEHGVEYCGVPGTTLIDSRQILDFVQDNTSPVSLYATCGVHPYNAAENPLDNLEQIEELRRLINSSGCLGVGECGLDYSEGFPSRDIQLQCFEQQLILALETAKPLYLHVRAAHSDFMEMMAKYGYSAETASSLPTAAAVHCFTGTVDELREYVSCGYYIGLTGYVTKLSMETLKTILQVFTCT